MVGFSVGDIENKQFGGSARDLFGRITVPFAIPSDDLCTRHQPELGSQGSYWNYGECSRKASIPTWKAGASIMGAPWPTCQS